MLVVCVLLCGYNFIGIHSRSPLVFSKRSNLKSLILIKFDILATRQILGDQFNGSPDELNASGCIVKRDTLAIAVSVEGNSSKRFLV